VISQARPVSAEANKNREFQAVITKDGEIVPEEIYFDQLSKKYTSDYLDKYSIKHIKDEDALRHELFENAQKYQEQQQDKKLHFSKSDSKINKKLVAKRVQVKPYVYDKKGDLIGEAEDYFQDIWCEVEDIKHKAKDSDSAIKKAKTLLQETQDLNRDELHSSEEENIEIKKSDYSGMKSKLYGTKKIKKAKVLHETQDLNQDEVHSSEEENIEIKKSDYSGVKSKLLSTKSIKKAKVLDPVEDKEKLDRRKERIKKFSEQTKWMPNSAFTTYYGKPAFENYGRGNVQPTSGGVIYGNYLKTHNVNPHRGKKNPQFKQTYNSALMYGSRMPVCEPELPRKVKEDYRLSQVKSEIIYERF